MDLIRGTSSVKKLRISIRAKAAPRQKCTPYPEGQVLVGFAADIKPERVGEHLVVPIRRDVGQQDRFAFGYALAPNDGVCLRRAHELLDRNHPANHLLDGRSHQTHVCRQAGKFGRILQKRKQSAGDGGTRGVVAALATIT